MYVIDQQEPIVLNQADLGWESWGDPELAAKSPVRWKILVSGERGLSNQLITGIAEMAPGSMIPLHYHEPVETYYILSGCGYVTMEDCETAVSPGSSVFIPSRAIHSLRCAGGENLVFLFTFAADRFDEIVYEFDINNVSSI